MSATSHPKYRPDIDGLRAFAVLPVVIFHAFPEVLKGGYAGVDVFFVISGFLISSIIFSNINKGTFSFLDFYSRRIRRIFPTLLTVLISCLVFGYFAMLPDEYMLLGKHVAGGSFFVSNFVLFLESGYFDTTSITKPLLHLWSLGVEEQFYIVWPILLALLWKRRINLFLVAFTCFLLSFYFNISTIETNPSLTFYSPVTRFWEILAGSMLAWVTIHKRDYFSNLKNNINRVIANATKTKSLDIDYLGGFTSICGLIILTFGYATLTEDIQFPGYYAIIPVSAAVLLIMSGPNAIVNKYILSFPVFIWIGLISFPLYLWHWPLLSFAYIMESGVPSEFIRGALVIFAIALSIFSYHVVESKLRFGGNLTGKTLILTIIMIIVGGTGLYVYHSEGFKSRFDTTQIEAKDDQNIKEFFVGANNRCRAVFPEWSKLTDNMCSMQKESGQNKIAIVGDSHAGHLFLGMSEHNKKDGVVVFPASCAAPFIDVSSATKNPSTLNVRKYSYKLINSAYDYIIKDNNIHEVVLAHRPSCSYNDAIDIQEPTEKNSSVIIERGMRRSLDKLVKAGKKVVIVKDNPELPFIPKACIVRPLTITNSGGKCSFDKSYYLDNSAHRKYNTIVDKVVKDYPSVNVVDLSEALCDKNKCYLSKDSHVLYYDKTHLTKYGSRYVAPFILGK